MSSKRVDDTLKLLKYAESLRDLDQRLSQDVSDTTFAEHVVSRSQVTVSPRRPLKKHPLVSAVQNPFQLDWE